MPTTPAAEAARGRPPARPSGPPAPRPRSARHRHRPSRTAVVLVGLSVLVAAGVVALVAYGSVPIPLVDVVDILLGGSGRRDVHRTIVLDARLPKAITAVLAGAALGVGGAQMQTLFRNPLADPYVLGVSSGASLGAAVVILGTTDTGLLSGLGVLRQLGVTGAAVAGAAVVLLAALVLARRVGSPVTILVAGVMFGLLAAALVDLLVYYADPERLAAFTGFLRGSVRGVSWDDLRFVAPVCLVVLVGSISLAKPLNVLLLGDRYARTMGIAVRRTQFVALASVAVLAGVVTAFCGVIGFVGLAAPHLARGLLRSSDHRAVLPAAALMGAAIVLVAELVASGPGGSRATLPLNSVTAFVGVPVVLWVLLSGRRSAEVPS